MHFRRLLPFALLPLMLAACGEDFQLPWDRAPAEPEGPPVTGPPAVSPLIEPVETAESAPVAVATAEARTLSEAAFVAQGPGNAWRVEVNGNTARYLRAGARPVNVNVRRITFARGVEYIGVLGGAPFALTVLGSTCEAAGMDRGWTMAARLKTGSRRSDGCAASATSAPASTMPPPPAVQAAPAPKRAAPTPAPPATATPPAAASPDPPAASPPADNLPADGPPTDKTPDTSASDTPSSLTPAADDADTTSSTIPESTGNAGPDAAAPILPVDISAEGPGTDTTPESAPDDD